METYQIYKGYGIRYSTFMGITEVENMGLVIKRFVGFGEIAGKEAAKNYIDLL